LTKVCASRDETKYSWQPTRHRQKFSWIGNE
jgi:hypothetical protein